MICGAMRYATRKLHDRNRHVKSFSEQVASRVIGSIRKLMSGKQLVQQVKTSPQMHMYTHTYIALTSA